MIVLTRRGVLMGATALSAAGLVPPLAAQEAIRTNHAVLVACTAYANLPKRVSLIGPNNDATMVRDFLMQSAPVKFLPDNIALLADGIEGAAASPTHRNILDALAATARKAQRGDFVYIHFSGHGSRQPAVDPRSETDGMDEIFLPADTGVWSDAAHIPNALLDNQIGAALDAIRTAGAFVWFVIDACHSGTASRAAAIDDDFAVERQVKPEDLGIPDDRLAKVGGAGGSRSVSGRASLRPAFGMIAPAGVTAAGKGGLVGFYAAQTVETTPELPLPKGVDGAVRYGLFTYTLFSKIAESQNPAMTYRQLGQAVLQQYAADARNRPTPLFDGDLDAPVFGIKSVNTVPQWPLYVADGAISINAGLLHRLSPGAALAIMARPQDATEDAMGTAEVISASNLTSRLKLVAMGDKPAAIDAIPPNAYARVTDLTLDLVLVVARPAETAELGEDVRLVNAMLDQVSSREGKRYNVTLVEPGKEADIRLAVMRENAVANATMGATDKPALWFLSATGDIAANGDERPPLIAIDRANPARLADATAANFEKIFRAVSLSRVASMSDYRGDQVTVAFNIRREGNDKEAPLDASTVPAVSPGDIVTVAAKNLSSKMVDINVLYVGSDYSITHMKSDRLEPNGGLTGDLLIFTDDSFGIERMIAVLTEASHISEKADLSFLQQGGVPPEMRGRTNTLMDLLIDIGNAPTSRAALKRDSKGGQKGAVVIFSVQNVPRGS